MGDASVDLGVAGPDLARVGCRDEDKQAGTTCIREVSGKVVDDKGAPIAEMITSLCAELCFFGKTEASGEFTVIADAWIPIERYAMSLHARPNRASYYVPAPPATSDRPSYAAPLVVLPLPGDGPLIDLSGKPQQTLASGDVTLDIGAASTILIDPEDIEAGDAGRRFRALYVEDPKKMPFVDPAAPPLSLYAFAPFELQITPPAKVTLVNRTGLAAGTAVEFLVLRGLIGDVPPAGTWRAAGTGRVSGDGQRIEMDPGAGISSLTWLAIRKKG